MPSSSRKKFLNFNKKRSDVGITPYELANVNKKGTTKRPTIGNNFVVGLTIMHKY